MFYMFWRIQGRYWSTLVYTPGKSGLYNNSIIITHNSITRRFAKISKSITVKAPTRAFSWLKVSFHI